MDLEGKIMISSLNSSGLNHSYINSTKGSQKRETSTVVGNSQLSGNRIEKLKTAVASGEYKIDLSALANKMADELL